VPELRRLLRGFNGVIEAATPITPEQQALIERLFSEERLRVDIRAKLDDAQTAKKASFWNTLLDKDTVKLLISAIFIPFIIWTAGTAWKNITLARNAPAFAKQKAEAAHNKTEARRRADVAQMTVLLPWVGQGSAEGQIAREVLRSLARSSPDDPFVQSVYEVAQQTATTQQYSREPAIRKQGALSKEALRPAPLPNVEAGPPPLGVRPNQAVAAAAVNAGTKPQSVYLQIYGEDQRPLALAVQGALRDEGIPVPGIENVLKTQGGTAATDALVRRYAQRGTVGVRFYSGPDRAAAAVTASVISRVLGSSSTVVIQDLSARTRKASSGTLEVWFPCGSGQGC